jgi:uncharacterized protein YjbJ (UPF0337 family)
MGKFRLVGTALQSARRTLLCNTQEDEHIQGTADKAKSAIKDTAGKAMGDREMQAEGKIDKAKGAVHSAVGDAKDAIKNANKKLDAPARKGGCFSRRATWKTRATSTRRWTS